MRPNPATSENPAPWRLLFVCLGNICRSPLAEGVFLAVATERGVRGRVIADSCGLGGWHAGEQPDPRSQDVARRYGVSLSHCARQLDPSRDFDRFDLLLAMDRENVSGLLRAGCPRTKVRLLRSFEALDTLQPPGTAPVDPEVPDPYYGGREGFEAVYRMIRRSSEGLVETLLTRGLT